MILVVVGFLFTLDLHRLDMASPSQEGLLGLHVYLRSLYLMTLILAAWVWKADPRRWMRWLGVAALGAVILQGLLGGLTVRYFLPPAVSTAHAGLAEIFFCTTGAIALFTSKSWNPPSLSSPSEAKFVATGARQMPDDGMLRRVATTTATEVDAAHLVQLMVGRDLAAAPATSGPFAVSSWPL